MRAKFISFLAISFASMQTVAFASVEQFFCVPTGTMFVGDFRPDMPVGGREVVEAVRRSPGDGTGFILEVNASTKTSEMRIKRTLNGVKKETISRGPVTLFSKTIINITLDDAMAKNFGYDGDGNSRLVSLVVMREQGEYVLSALMVGEGYKSSFLAGGKCNKL